MDGKIPDWVLEGPKIDPNRQRQDKARMKDKTSNFLITIDPNISASTMVGERNKEYRIQRYKQLLAVKSHIAEKFSRGELLKPFGNDKEWHPPKLTHLGGDPEFGPEHGRLHIHLSVSFGGTCHINNGALREFVVKSVGDNGWKIMIKHIKDSVQLSRDYALKSDNPEHLEREIDKFRGPIIGGVEETEEDWA